MRCRYLKQPDDVAQAASLVLEASRAWNSREKLEMLDATNMDMTIAASIAGALTRNTIVAEADDARIVGLLSLESQPWESEVFGWPFYKIRHLLCAREEGESCLNTFDRMLEQADTLLARERRYSVMARVSISDMTVVEALVNRGFKFVESRLVFERAPIEIPLSERPTVRPIMGDDISVLSAMAEKSFSHSRFHSDGQIPRVLADRSRWEWVKNACEGRLNRVHVYVSAEAGKPAGFVLCKEKTSLDGILYGVLDLIAVDFPMRGRGHGRNLVRTFIDHSARKCSFVQVATQAQNISSVRLYEHEGFRLACSGVTLHKHICG